MLQVQLCQPTIVPWALYCSVVSAGHMCRNSFLTPALFKCSACGGQKQQNKWKKKEKFSAVSISDSLTALLLFLPGSAISFVGSSQNCNVCFFFTVLYLYLFFLHPAPASKSHPITYEVERCDHSWIILLCLFLGPDTVKQTESGCKIIQKYLS